ncbi:MAG: polysaccharide deacetylase family protein [Bacteroidales bacterium]|nr:polysaccharide deacetylase family protein [Bacteroidales bacterium]
MDIKYSNTAKIFFMLSDSEFNLSEIVYSNKLPILYPLSRNEKIYFFKGKNLVFNHDLLKSAFHLLSGYQEICVKERDFYDRFPYEQSIQKKLGIADIPLVNYYFEWISEGIKEFCKLNKLTFKRRKIFNSFGLNLTHDIDQLNFHTINRLLYKIKELSGMVPTTVKKTKLMRQIIKTSLELFKFGRKENPSWNFEELRTLEKKYNFKSSFFFLSKDPKNQDAGYSFDDPRLIKLFEQLKKEGCEIGLHGTIGSAKNINKLSMNIRDLEKHAQTKVHGERQHCLVYYYPDTLIRHKEAGLRYDTGLGFAEHEGFRNSYCLPFKPFNFEKDEMIDIWEIPLNVMEVTLFYYRKLKPDDAFKAFEKIIKEVIKFNGIFTLLWHNGATDEDRFPGIQETYEKILAYIYKENPESMTGNEIVKKMDLVH